jgi:hypothetical protein
MLKKSPFITFSLLLCALCHSFVASGQCNDYAVQTITTIPDNCGLATALNFAPYVNTCKTICIDNTTATASSTQPSCGSGTISNDVWGYVLDPYTNIPNFNGSLVVAWKKYPSYPVNPPTLAVHLDVDCNVKLGFITVLNSDLNCGFLAGNADNFLCIDNTSANQDNTLVLPANSIPTNPDLQSILDCQVKVALGSSYSVQNLTSAAYYFQLETYNNVPGLLCMEVSSYQPGFSCGDPQTVTFPNTGLTQSQSVSKCLCGSAANSGYFTPSTQPCPFPANGINVGTTAYYKVSAPYACNQLGVTINSWPTNSGTLNVAILRDIDCAIILDTVQLCPTLPAQYTNNPNWVVSSATQLASACLSATAGSNSVLTDVANCLPAGDYYVLISANNDKDTFGATLTVNNNTPTGVVVQARAFLEGAYAGASSMSTTLRSSNNIPLAQPYNRAPWLYAGTESATSLSAIPTNAVDWVLLEVRNATTNALIETRAAFLLSNGLIVDADGTTNGVRFQNITSGSSYKLAVRHRNHLAVIGANAVTVPNATPYDFAATAQVVAGATQLKNVGGGIYALHAGDTHAEGVITYFDYNKFAAQIGTALPYSDGDCNLDGVVNGSDFSIMQPNIQMCNVTEMRL